MSAPATIQLGLVPEYNQDATRRPRPRGNRGTLRRKDLDFWPTPDWLARAILRQPGACPWNLGCTILDAGAGEGVLGEEAERLAAERVCRPPQITALELHPGRAAELRRKHPSWEVVEADLFEWGPAQFAETDGRGRTVRPGRTWDLVLTNPPQKRTATATCGSSGSTSARASLVGTAACSRRWGMTCC